MGTGSFPGIEIGRSVTLTPHTLLVPRSKNSRAIPLLFLRAFVACIKVETYLRKKIIPPRIAACQEFLLGILIFKGLTLRRLYMSFGVKGLNIRKYYPYVYV
jgi:hypothetical protein